MKKFTYSLKVSDDFIKKHPDYLQKKREHRNDPYYWYPGEFTQHIKDCWIMWVFGVIPVVFLVWFWVDMGCPIPIVCGGTWFLN